jgi:hypothetical protein
MGRTKNCYIPENIHSELHRHRQIKKEKLTGERGGARKGNLPGISTVFLAALGRTKNCYLPENIHCASCSYGQNKKILHTREFPI